MCLFFKKNFRFAMKKIIFFEFKDSQNNLRFIASNGDEFIKSFINFDNEQWLGERLERGDFERWLKDVGEIELYNLILDVKNNNKLQTTKQKIKRIRHKFRLIQYFQPTEINQVIEIYLKEYETLRQEILFYMQNRTQIIFLGLTGIFAIAGLALTPLTDFFTTEEIKIDSYSFDIPNIITRAIDGNTINNQAIIPTIIILAIIVPIASLYVIYRISDSTKQIYLISKYIKSHIEKEINLLINHKLINQTVYSKINRIKPNFLYWETWITKNRNDLGFEDKKIIGVIKFLFLFIIFLSLLGSFILLSWDFASAHQQLNFEKENYQLVYWGFAIWTIIIFCLSVWFFGFKSLVKQRIYICLILVVIAVIF